MSQYVRSQQSGGTFFFTVVTLRREKVLIQTEYRRALRQAILDVRQSHPFHIDAMVLLPEHLHCIWTLPKNDSDYSRRWGMIKARTTRQLRSLLHQTKHPGVSRVKHRDGSLWQRRFWEHQIRNDADFRNHFDYIHFNPVKHGLVQKVVEWPHSTFHRYVRAEVYSEDWGSDVEMDGAFGE